jgi:putative membrane protein
MTNSSLDTKAYRLIAGLSTLVIVFLFWLIYFNPGRETDAAWVTFLPTVNASLNTITTFFLIMGYLMIKIGQKKAHILLMLSATTTSGLFLISYIIYHHFHGDTLFLTQGYLRPIYFFILISHIILSIGLVPMVFATLYHAFRKNLTAHRKLARWTFPIWIYVSITGVLIYLFVQFLNVPPS